MTYEQSFLSTADAKGNVPVWAFFQIFEEHGSAPEEFIDNTEHSQLFNGETILDWLGY